MRPRSWRAPAFACLAFGLTCWSCGGGGDGARSPAFTVSSADGVLTLSLPEGALPAGVTQAEVQVTPVPAEEQPALNRVGVERAYSLKPDGVVLSAPARLAFTLPGTEVGGRTLMLLHESGPRNMPRLEVIAAELETLTAPERLVLTGTVGHFSRVVIGYGSIDDALVTFSIDYTPLPGLAFIGEPFRAEAVIHPVASGKVEYFPVKTILDQGPAATLSWNASSRWTIATRFKVEGPVQPTGTLVETENFVTAPGLVETALTLKCGSTGEYLVGRSFVVDVEGVENLVVLRQTAGGGAPGRGMCVAASADPIADMVDSVSSFVVQAARQAADLAAHGARRETKSAAQVQAEYGNTLYPCGLDEADIKVVCPATVQPMPAGDVLTFFLRVNAPIPRADATTSYIYSVVLDSDGVAANDWRFVAPFDWDYFQGTDRWYQLSWNHMTQAWSLTATQVDASQQTAVVPTTARAVLAGDSIVFHISATELAAARGYRLSAFGHDGRFTQATRGGDVTGANPTEALLPMPQ